MRCTESGKWIELEEMSEHPVFATKRGILAHWAKIAYKIRNWKQYCKKDPKPQKTSRFFCSALIGYIYTKLNLFEENVDWSILYPSYFSSENKSLSMLHNANLTLEHLISY